jgi:hypothetical protein
MPGVVPVPTPIVHMTHISNLPAIIERGGLVAMTTLAAEHANVTSIAYTSIQQQRATKQVPCGAGGCLHDYVPFYFCRRSPMLFTISRGNVPCEGGQDAIVHFVSTAQRIEEEELDFAFTDGHGIMNYTSFYDDLDDLDEVDWPLIAAQYWVDTREDGDRRRRRQAEFLVHGDFDWEMIDEIVVRSAARKQQVVDLIADLDHKPAVSVKPDWYY